MRVMCLSLRSCGIIILYTDLNRALFPLVLGGLMLWGNPLAEAATYYVALSGNDASSGTQTAPWRTIQKAADVVVAGDTVLVGPGDYGEKVNLKRQIPAGDYITFDGQGVATNAQFQLSMQNIRIRNFILTGLTTKFTGAIDLRRGAHGAYIEGNQIDTAYADSVRAVNWDFGSQTPIDPNVASRVTITNNSIVHIYNTVCITLMGTNNLVVNNRMRDIRDADYFHVFGVSNTVRGNICIGFEDTPNSGNHMDCFQTFGLNGHASKHMIIEENVFGYNYNPTDVDIAQICQLEQNLNHEIHNWDIRNNIFFGLLKGECGIPSVRWHNNVFYQIWTNAAGGAIIINWAESGRNNATNAQILNNVFLGCGKNDQSGWYSVGDGSSIVTNTWKVDFNYVAALDGSPKRAGLPQTNQRWYEPHGINGGSDCFQDIRQHDFRLRQDAPLRNKGVNLSNYFSRDHTGNARPVSGNWDIGAMQFVASENRVVLPPSFKGIVVHP